MGVSLIESLASKEIGSLTGKAVEDAGGSFMTMAEQEAAQAADTAAPETSELTDELSNFTGQGTRLGEADSDLGPVTTEKSGLKVTHEIDSASGLPIAQPVQTAASKPVLYDTRQTLNQGLETAGAKVKQAANSAVAYAKEHPYKTAAGVVMAGIALHEGTKSSAPAAAQQGTAGTGGTG